MVVTGKVNEEGDNEDSRQPAVAGAEAMLSMRVERKEVWTLG